jgi:hypothetical protein
MLKNFIESVFQLGQSYLDIIHRPDVCMHTGCLVPRRPDGDLPSQSCGSFSQIGIGEKFRLEIKSRRWVHLKWRDLVQMWTRMLCHRQLTF